ncbi:hypothetical protein CSUI_007798 [Cystoisospora suis]|uniref:Transmembrane protein n=1 Tax=Cystoisospora suis TaxID=483139 RepID=A0A2C6KPH1_9APIC|nr:hypothetical protein CSUI_007798 [Cystoisospora suis]
MSDLSLRFLALSGEYRRKRSSLFFLTQPSSLLLLFFFFFFSFFSAFLFHRFSLSGDIQEKLLFHMKPSISSHLKRLSSSFSSSFVLFSMDR